MSSTHTRKKKVTACHPLQKVKKVTACQGVATLMIQKGTKKKLRKITPAGARNFAASSSEILNLNLNLAVSFPKQARDL